ncbi:MAG: hypothetical protein J6X38_03240 [Abditibacteriota bacterium]|nr:hypothetical protein [Abditibacteriota bacterium]
MSATKPYDSARKDGIIVSHKMAAEAKIFAGTIVCLNGSGYAVPGSDTSGLKMAGVAYETVDNTNGADGGKSVRVYTKGTFAFADSGAVQSDVGKIFYIADDKTVTNGSTSAGIAAGVCVANESPTLTRIRIDGKII